MRSTLSKSGVTISGVEAVVRAALAVDRKARAAVARGLRAWGEETMAIAKSEYVPVRFGVLRASGTVKMLEEEGEQPKVELSFGGDSPAGAYAIIVHEVPAEHRIGEDKFLEKPALRESKELQATIAHEVKKGMNL